MTPEEVYSCVRFLSDCYGVPAPTVIITDEIPRAYAGCYDPDTQTIFLRPSALNEKTVVHEFDHHLQEIYGLPNERGAEEFEEVADCEVCRRVFPTPETAPGSEAMCPWCGSVYKKENPPEVKVNVAHVSSTFLGVLGIALSFMSLAQAYQYRK